MNPPIDPSALAALRASVRGDVLSPGEPGYDDSRRLWNAMIDRHPAAVLRCVGAADIRTGVRFARDNGLPLCIKGGGHNIAGLAVADGGLLLDLGRMRGVWVDPTARRARAQAGCILGDVDRETQAHGLAAVLGFVSETGIAGLTLGGGFGYLSRRWGWTSDNVTSMDLVTADGRLVRASQDENPDLFWALRGGGGNFGVVTSIEYALHEVGPEVTGGVVAWRAADAPEILERYREIAAEAPREHSCVALMRPAPPAPWLPAEMHGQPIVALLVCDTGPEREAAGRAARIKSLGKPVGDILQRRPYTQQQALLDATQPKGRRYYWKSEYLPDVPAGLPAPFREWGARAPSPHSAMILFPLGGAIADRPADHSAVGNRDAGMVLNITAAWESPDDDARAIGWAREAWEEFRRFSTGGTYLNFLTEEESDERVRAALGGNYQRLAGVKAAWDPENLFRTNKNILPAG